MSFKSSIFYLLVSSSWCIIWRNKLGQWEFLFLVSSSRLGFGRGGSMILKVLTLLKLVHCFMTVDFRREIRVIWRTTEKTARTVVSQNLFFFFFFRVTLSHRIQINSSTNSFRFVFFTCNSKRCMESLRPRLDSHFNPQQATQSDSFIHPLDMHMSVPVYIRLYKRDKTKSFYLDQFQLIADVTSTQYAIMQAYRIWLEKASRRSKRERGDGTLPSH